jgi:MFS family permease
MGLLSRLGAQWTSLGRDAKLVLLYQATKSIGTAPAMLFLSLYILSLGHSRETLGLLLSMASLPALALAIPVGALAARWGPRRTCLVGIIGLSGALCFAALAISVPQLVISRLLVGILMLLPTVSLWPLLAGSSAPERRATLFSLDHSVKYLANLVGSVGAGVLPLLLASTLDIIPGSPKAYRGAMLVGAALVLVSALPLALMTNRPAARPAKITWSPDSRKRLGGWAKLVIPNLIFSLGAALFMPFLNVFFKHEFAVSDELLGTLFGLMTMFSGLAGLGAPFLAGKLGRIRAIVLLQLASLPFLISLGLVRWLPLVVLAFWLRAALCKTGDPLYWAFMMDNVEPEDRPLLNGISTLTMNLGGTFMPYISGLVQMRYGFSPLFFAGAGLYALGAGTTWAFFGRGDQAEARIPRS